jgi:hypothetical protein
MKHYPADYNVFALVRIQDKSCAPKDKWIKKYVETKINEEFIGTAEDDIIFYTLYDLEQFTGQNITWVKNESLDEVFAKNGLLPSALRRYCTAETKVKPIAQWCVDNFKEPVDLRIGFRANEMSRAKKSNERHNKNNYREEKLIVGKHKNGNNKWKSFEWARNSYPLIQDNIYKDQIVKYWKDKPVRFAERNNCVACFHKNPILLNLMAQKFPNKYKWFEEQEEIGRNKIAKNGKKLVWNTYRKDGLYKDFRKHKSQLSLEDLEDFTECDSGHCGI